MADFSIPGVRGAYLLADRDFRLGVLSAVAVAGALGAWMGHAKGALRGAALAIAAAVLVLLAPSTSLELFDKAKELFGFRGKTAKPEGKAGAEGPDAPPKAPSEPKVSGPFREDPPGDGSRLAKLYGTPTVLGTTEAVLETASGDRTRRVEVLTPRPTEDDPVVRRANAVSDMLDSSKWLGEPLAIVASEFAFLGAEVAILWLLLRHHRTHDAHRLLAAHDRAR